MISSTSIKVKNQLSRRNMIGYGIQSIKSVSWSIVRSVDRSVGRSVGRLVGRSVGRFNGFQIFPVIAMNHSEFIFIFSEKHWRDATSYEEIERFVYNRIWS